MVQKPEAKRRGRPPAYRREEALGRALERFWTAGYAATSLDEISRTTGMNRPSLYGAFGDKRALFREALGHYRRMGGGVMAAIAARGAPVRVTLRDAYRAALDLYFSGQDGARGCFLTGAALAGAVEDPEMGAELLAGLHDLDRGFAGLFRIARDRGEIPASSDPAALAFLASALLHTLSVRARAGTPRAELEGAVESALSAILGEEREGTAAP